MNLLPGIETIQNIHPLFVHFPVALILTTLLFEAFWWMTKKDKFRDFATYLLVLSVLFSVAAVITGYLASNSLGHDAPGHDFVHEHRNVMMWMSGILLVTVFSVLFVRPLREGNLRRLLIIPLLVIGALLVYGADKGGQLVFEYGMGVKAISEDVEHGSSGHTNVEKSTNEDPENRTAVPDSSMQKKHIHSDGHEHQH